MTNKQKIAELETKLRRYEKRIGDLQKLNAKLSVQVVGSTQIGKAVDAILIQTALAYGEAAIDPDICCSPRAMPARRTPAITLRA